MTTTDTTDHDADALQATVDTWLAAYCEPDAARRAELIAQVWDPDGELVDPPLTGSGHETIAALGGAVVGLYPDHAFRRTTPIDAHHGHARYGWELVGPGGTRAVAGIDVVELAADGRLRKVVGFFG